MAKNLTYLLDGKVNVTRQTKMSWDVYFFVHFTGKGGIMAAGRYKRISYEDRLNLERLFKSDITKTDISKELGISRETLYKEAKRGLNPETGKYEALRAQKAYCVTPK